VYPIPDIKGNLSLMAGSKYFTLLDIASACWHIPVHPDDKDKTGFITPFGSFIMDGILIFSDTVQEHARRMRMVFERIREANFKLNLDKCTFAASKVAYLGHVVNASGVTPDMSKVTAIRKFPLPGSVRNVPTFLRLTGYYRFLVRILQL
jgi:hypothetical protein